MLNVTAPLFAVALISGLSPVARADAQGQAYFAQSVHQFMRQDCMKCHAHQLGRFRVTDDPAETYAFAKKLITPGSLDTSLLYQKLTGTVKHAGGTHWPDGSVEMTNLKTWIQGEVAD